MASRLPDDLLHMICGALSQQKDFNTLFLCACSGKQLAVPALAGLYRMHNKAPITGSGSDDAVLTGEERIMVTAKWTNLWQSIVLSCLGKTLFNYAQYIRKLDFQDLETLLDESIFWRNFSSKFFDRPLKRFKIERVTKQRGRQFSRIDANATTNSIAQLVLQHTPTLEKLAGNFQSPEIIQGFLPYTPHLQRLRVFDGSVLRDVGESIRTHCRKFAKIRIFIWSGSDADHDCAMFLNGLRPQTLRAFGVLGGTRLSVESFLALNSHSQCLSKLELRSISAESMQYLSRLKNCTEITSLNLAEDIAATQDLENRHKDIFLEMIEWLRGCHQLREITLSNFISAPPLLTPVMRERGIELDSLEIEGYSLTGSKDFHQAMALQPSLTSLYLKGEDSEVVADNDILVDAINRLINLRDLRLTQISANFTEHHIRSLAQNLHKLETFWTGGFHITDAIWPDIAELGRLKRLELNADTRFTSNGIVDFVLSLGPGNEGFTLSVMMQDTDSDIAEIEQDMIRETLASRVGGRFDFLLVRGPEDEFANEDSDSE